MKTPAGLPVQKPSKSADSTVTAAASTPPRAPNRLLGGSGASKRIGARKPSPAKRPTGSNSPPPAPPTGSLPPSGADADLLASAYRKVVSRQTLSFREKKALQRHEKEKEERLRWSYYSSIPAKHWNQMSGRQAKVIREQANRYGLPFDGPMVNLPAVVRALHNFLADNAVKLSREADDLMDSGPASPALERYREERVLLAQMDRLEREKTLVPRAEMKLGLTRIAMVLRGAGEGLQRQFGPEAMDLYYEALDEAQRQIDALFADETAIDSADNDDTVLPSDDSKFNPIGSVDDAGGVGGARLPVAS